MTKSKNHYFKSEGHIYLANMPIEFNVEKNIKLFPFLIIKFKNWTGETNGIYKTPFIKSYIAEIYTSIDNNLILKITNKSSRMEIESYIRKFLEIRFLSHSLIYKESLQFIFQNTYPIKPTDIPKNIKPAEIKEYANSLLDRLTSDQEHIIDGKLTFTSLTSKQLSKDITHDKFTLVKSSSFGASFSSLIDTSDNKEVSEIIEKIAIIIEDKNSDYKLIKSLGFIRRALVLEKSGFFNESYLNYFRCLESIANTDKKNSLIEFFTELSRDEIESFLYIRSTVAAHGNSKMDNFREVGQIELSKLKDFVIKRLLSYILV